MAYSDRNFKTKKALKEAVAAHAEGRGAPVTAFQPGPFGDGSVPDGTICIEGPHYPAPHTWYATCTVKGGIIIRVK